MLSLVDVVVVEVDVVLADLPWPFDAPVVLFDALCPEVVDFVDPDALEPFGAWAPPFGALVAPVFGACAFVAPVVPAFGPCAPTVAVNAITVAVTANGKRFIVGTLRGPSGPRSMPSR